MTYWIQVAALQLTKGRVGTAMTAAGGVGRQGLASHAVYTPHISTAKHSEERPTF